MNLSQLYNLVVAKQYPATLVHFITERCNARCSFCFIDFNSPTHGKGELHLTEIEALTRMLPDSLTNVNFTGGEPFLRSDIADIASAYFTNSKVQSIFITTNGYFTDRIESFCKAITQKFPEKEIFIALSIDDFPENHNRIRNVKGLFEKCMATFIMLKQFEKNVRPSVSITISQENMHRVESLYEMLLGEYAVDAVQIIMVRSEGVFKLDENYRQELLQVYNKLSKKLENDYSALKLKGFDRKSFRGMVLNQKNSIARNIVNTYLNSPHYMHPCQSAALFGVINSKGDVYPCEILDKSMGNLRDYQYDLKRLWKDSAATEIRQFISKTKCNCEYDCALSVNILSNPKYLIKVTKGLVS